MNNANTELLKNNFKKLLADSVVGNDIFEITYELSKGDDADQSSEERECHLEMRLKGRNFIYLKKVQEALVRMEEGTFGECQDCGCDIEAKRLMARPTASKCLSCKEEEEIDNNKMFNKNRYSAKREGNVPELKLVI